MASDTILRTAAGIISSGLYNDENLPFGPRKYGQSAPFVRENLNIQPIGGSAALNTTVTYRVRKQGDFSGRIAFRGTLRALPAPTTPLSQFARYMDAVALGLFKEIRIKYNSQKLQTIKPLELLMHQEFHQNDEEQATSSYNTLKDLTDAQRYTDAQAGPQNFKINLYTCFIQHDQSNHFFVNGLANDLEVEIDFETAANIVQTDDSAYVLPADSTFLSNTALQVEYIHITENKRQDMVATYANPNGIRYLFNDYQYYSDRIPGTTALNGSVVSVQIRSNINAPCSVLYVILRWVEDLTRQAGGAGGDRGRDLTNFSGWYAPDNNKLHKIFSEIYIKSGNNDIVKQYPVDEYLWDKRTQFFVGTASASAAIFAFSFADAPLLTNAHTGSFDPSVIDTPTLYLVTNASSTFATINAAADANLHALSGGTAGSDLQVDFVSESKNFVDILGHDALRPFA
jgi:hypothetical protein